jgi:sugar O-acyltransferase (sialic acid O-acetyltransferase NeuD family)
MQTNKPLLIIGGSGHGSMIASCIEDNRSRFNDLEWDIVGFINDYDYQINGYKVIGKTTEIEKFANEGFYFAWGIHLIVRNPMTMRVFEKINIPENRLATIVHNSAFIERGVELSPGTSVMCNAYIGARTKLGIGTMVKPNASIGHDVTSGPLCHFTRGSITGSFAHLGVCSDVAIGSIVLEHRMIGDYSIAGAGSLVTHDIPDYEIHVGRPAKFLKRIKED